MLNTLLASDHCDLVLAVAGSSAQFQPEVAIEPLIEAERHGKPLASFAAPHAEASLKLLMDAGIAGFCTPSRAPMRYARGATGQRPSSRRRSRKSVSLLRRRHCRRPVNNWTRTRLLQVPSARVPIAESEIIATADQQSRVPFPIVAKVLSADILHKTDAGGVVLNITSHAALRSAALDILERSRSRYPDARIEGILVQRMEKGLAELILGFNAIRRSDRSSCWASAACSRRSTRISQCVSRPSRMPTRMR